MRGGAQPEQVLNNEEMVKKKNVHEMIIMKMKMCCIVGWRQG